MFPNKEKNPRAITKLVRQQIKEINKKYGKPKCSPSSFILRLPSLLRIVLVIISILIQVHHLPCAIEEPCYYRYDSQQERYYN